MASLVDKVTRSLPLAPGERVMCAAIARPGLTEVRRHGKEARRHGNGFQWPLVVCVALAVGVSSAIQPGDVATAALLGGVGGLIGSVISSFVRRPPVDESSDPSGWIPVYAVTDRRFVTSGQWALKAAAPVAWRSVPLDAATRVDFGERKAMGIVTAFTFSVHRAGEEPLAFELQRPKDAVSFQAALAPRDVPSRPDALPI
jgi:hypothetical protein